MSVSQSNIKRRMMSKNESYLAVIPARGGSKRLPRKNIMDLAGKPLIAWTIEAALNSACISDVVISTDDPEIADIARQYGASVPFLRPDDLATDLASSFDVIRHTLDFYSENGTNYDFLILLQPTSPLRNARHIDDAISLLRREDADAIVSVTEMRHSPHWANTLPDNGSMSDFLREEIKKGPRQSFEAYYRLNGAIYICNTKRLLEEGTLFLQDNIFAYRMERISSVDIDDEIDFLFADILMRKQVGRI
jgi:CMP-N-acetylneuraminic acid synthetase